MSGVNSSGGWVYLLHGDDTFSRDEAVLSLKKRMRALAAGEHNMSVLSGSDATLASLRAHADAVPFLAERRVVIVEGLIGRLQGKTPTAGGRRRAPKSSAPASTSEYSDLLEYLPRVPFTTSLAFVEGAGIDPQPIEKAIPAGRAHVTRYAKPWPDDLPRWVRKRAKLAQVELDESAVRELASLGPDNLRRIDTEIRKLGDYANGRTVTRADVRELVVGKETLVWALIDGIGDRRREVALSALRRLYAQGESPEKLFGADVAPYARRLMLAKELSLLPRAERDRVDIAALGLNPRTLPKLTQQAANFEPREIEEGLEMLLELDRGVKTGVAELEAGLELAVVGLCGRRST